MSFSKFFLVINISPLISINLGGLPVSVCGISFIVFIFSVTTSPMLPSPLVIAFVSEPFKYNKEIESPSTFGSHINSNLLLFKDKNLFVLSIKSFTSLKVNAFTNEPIGFVCLNFSN